jgi:hypothetical protein
MEPWQTVGGLRIPCPVPGLIPATFMVPGTLDDSMAIAWAHESESEIAESGHGKEAPLDLFRRFAFPAYSSS